MRKRLLFIMQLPPPVHGAAVVNKIIAESAAVKANYQTRILELKFVSQPRDIGVFSLKKVALIFPFIYHLVSTLINFRPCLVYYTLAPKGFAFYRDALFVGIIKLFRIKIAFHLHSRGIQNAVKGSRVRKAVYRFVFRDQTAISLANSLSYEFDGLHTKEILVLPNGIRDHHCDPSLRNNNVPVLLFLSNLFRDKGIFIFLEIIKELKTRQLNFRVNIAGKEGNVTVSELLELASRQDTADLITFSGPLYGEEKYKAFAEASIFVHPSLNEAFPLTILEAMQSSMPTVASAVGAIPDMISDGETGYVCAIGDIIAFADKLELLIKNPHRRLQMAAMARIEYETRYTFEKFESNLLKVVDHLVQR